MVLLDLSVFWQIVEKHNRTQQHNELAQGAAIVVSLSNLLAEYLRRYGPRLGFPSGLVPPQAQQQQAGSSGSSVQQQQQSVTTPSPALRSPVGLPTQGQLLQTSQQPIVADSASVRTMLTADQLF